jgi:hypothetical protein
MHTDQPEPVHTTQWHNPAIEPPPKGERLFLYTSGGITVVGTWYDEGQYLAWAPLLKKPEWVKR